MKEVILVEVRKEVAMRDSSGWKRKSLMYANGVKCYRATKQGVSFYFEKKPQCDWFCRLFYGTCTSEFLYGLCRNYPRYSYDVVVLRKKVQILQRNYDCQGT